MLIRRHWFFTIQTGYFDVMDKTEPLILEEIVSRAVNAAPTWDNVEIIIKDVLRWADQKPENRRVYDIDDQESELRN